ncbi:hypothetical protein [Paenibacillus sp. MABNR03]|uniref:hypothetical protein n=1 Tax=Paenibacillus sp. MABNR03 TaxID=3142626 RepID=UPI003D2DC4A2
MSLLKKSMKLSMMIVLSIPLVVSGCSSPSSSATSPSAESSKTPLDSSTETVKAATRSGEEHTLLSDNKEIQVSVPSNWKKYSNKNVEMLFTASDQQENSGLSITRVSKSDLAAGSTLEDAFNIFNDPFSTGLEPGPDTDTYKLNIDSKTASVIESKGSLNGKEVYYLNAALETNNHFYRIFLFHPDGSASEDHDTFVQIAESVKILNDEMTTEDPGRSSIVKKTLTSEDGYIQIRIPSNWSTSLSLVPDADLQASFVNNEDYMAVLHEAKEDVGADITLQDYYDLIMENNVNPEGNASISERVPVTINGMTGWQVEVRTEVERMKIGYVYTFLESATHFSQVIFWTFESRFDQAKDDYKEYTETYSENH